MRAWIPGGRGSLGATLEADSIYPVQSLRTELWVKHISQYTRSHFSTASSIPGALWVKGLITGGFITLRECYIL